MPLIERRDEGKSHTPDYSGLVLTEEQIARGVHRQWVGGKFDTDYPKSQVTFLRSQGLQPEHRVIDIGCGSFRGGRHVIDYLRPNNYFGVEANQSVIQAGYDHELTDDQRARVPVGNLRANDRFDVDFGVQFDFGIAQSVFSHVSLNHMRLCLHRLSKVMAPGGKFYATFFEENRKCELDYIRVSRRAKQRFSERNVFWYYRTDMEWAASFSPWRTRYIGDWGQLAGQRMVEYTRLDEHTSKPAAGRVEQFVNRGRRWAARRIAP